MKKIFTFVVALMGLFAVVQNASALVYNVTVPVGTQACFLVGDMNGWNTAANPMTKVDATHFTLDLSTAKATDGYKYCGGPDWKYEEKTAGGTTLPANRTWAAADVVANWSAVYLTAYEKDITIDVLVPATTIECYIVGNFNNWISPSAATKMTKVSTTADGIDFSIKIHTLDTTTLQFKFCAGPAWSYQQTVSANFNYMTSGAVVIVTSFTAIYDPAKTGTINITATVPATSEVWIMGDFLGWDMTKAVKGTKNANGTWGFSIPMVMTIQYRLYNHNDWGFAEVGQADPTVDLPNRNAVYPADANSAITVYAWKQAFTAIQQVDANKYKIYTNGKSIVVEGVTSQIDIIDISGRLIQSQKLVGKFASNDLKSGFYIVRVDGATTKVSVN
jgi:hypothetical protein